MNKTTRLLAQKYYNRIFKSNIPIDSMYIFGSAAKDTMRSASDVDVCVVSTAFGKDSTKERVFLMKLREGISEIIEPHPYSPEGFQSPHDTLAREIKKTGIKITKSSSTSSGP